MMKKIVYTLTLCTLFFLIISCEKDFKEIGGNVISNNNFNTKQVVLDVEIEALDIDAVRADDIALGNLGEYLLGVYNNKDYKKIEASIISQLGVTINPKTADLKNDDAIDSVYVFNEAALIIPYTSTAIGKESNGSTKFRLDSLLGDPNVPTSLKIYQNGTFLNTLDPTNPSDRNSYLSTHDYIELDQLNQDPNFNFLPKSTDTLFIIEREKSNGVKFKDTIKLGSETTTRPPFLAVRLDKAKIKTLFWDKFKDSEFSNQVAFNNYFRGLILKTEGNDGSLVPLTLGANSPRLEVYYTITRIENGTIKDTVPGNYSFPLNGITNSKYVMPNPAQNPNAGSNSFPIQGTAGSMARIKILNNTQLQELRSQNILINDASLIFNIDASRDTIKAPKRLFIYKEDKNSHVKDSYSEPAFFGGQLELNASKPEKYTVRITDHISDVVKGETFNSPLILKVFNTTTDIPTIPNTNQLDTIVKTYNWNPRGVSLLNNSTTNGEKRAKLIISYSEEKESN